MKHHKLVIAALGAVSLAGATLTLTLNSNAQGGNDPNQGPTPPVAGPRGGFPGGQGGQGFPGGGPPGQGGPGFPGGPNQPGQFRPGMGGGGGGGSAMVADGAFLYVLQGGMLFKVGKADLKVMGGTPLMPPNMGRPGDEPGNIRTGGGRPGGGTPPPAK